MRFGNCGWRVCCAIVAFLAVVSIVPAQAVEISFVLNHTTYNETNNRTGYHYVLRVSDPSILVHEKSTLELRGMDGLLSQGDATDWRNAGFTSSTATWIHYAPDGPVPFGEFLYFDVIADTDLTEPGVITYELDAEQGQIGTVEGPVAKDAPPAYKVSGTVYLDGDGSGGLYDPATDDILRGVTVSLVAADGSIVATTTSNSSIDLVGEGYIGNYVFPDVAPGNYTVVVASTVVIAGETLYATTATEQSISVVDASVRPVDFGYMPEPTYSISGTTFIDSDNNGVFDDGEQILAGVNLQLLDAGGNIVAQTTSGAAIFGTDGSYLGNYIFHDVPAGVYTVVAPQTVGELEITTTDTQTVEVVDADITGVDFGYLHPGDVPVDELVDVIAVVFFDANMNGKFDAGEMGFELVGVTLSGDASSSMNTDGDGYAFFGKYGVGGYNIAVTDGGALKLLDYWHTTTPISYNFTIDADTNGPLVFEFGFYPDTDKIRSGDIIGLNRTIGFWSSNIEKAIRGQTNGVQVSKHNLLQWLAEIEDLFLDEPYDFGEDKLARALWYLTPRDSGNSPEARLARQLLAAELNWVAGFRSSEPALEAMMLWWAEWVYNYQPSMAGEVAEFIDWWNNLGNAGGSGLSALDGSIGDEDTKRVE